MSNNKQSDGCGCGILGTAAGLVILAAIAGPQVMEQTRNLVALAFGAIKHPYKSIVLFAKYAFKFPLNFTAKRENVIIVRACL